MGYCEFCGQAVAGAETNEEATAECQCFEAVNARKRARATADAKQIVDDLFGSGARVSQTAQNHQTVMETQASALRTPRS